MLYNYTSLDRGPPCGYDRRVATGEQRLATTASMLGKASDPQNISPETTTSFASRIAQEWRTGTDGRNAHSLLRSELRGLLDGSVKCTQPKPPSTKETRKEAFDLYMKIVYKVPHNIKVDFEEDSNEIPFEPKFNTTCFTPVSETSPAQTASTPVKAKEKKRPKKKSVEESKSDKEPESVSPPPPVIDKKPAIVKEIFLPNVPASPTSPPQLKPPQTSIALPLREPSPEPQTSIALPLREPSPEPPEFLREFISKDWFKTLYPDKNKIPSSLCPDAFSMQLSDYLCTCSTQHKPLILSALDSMHRQKLLQNSDRLHQKLLDAVPKLVKRNMGASEHSWLVELFHLLISLNSANDEIMTTLLTLIAYKGLGLQERIMSLLMSFGVSGAEEWLQPELESWESQLLNKRDKWNGLQVLAGRWLRSWTAKYKDYIEDLYLRRSAGKWKPPSFTAVDVLNHFCSVQKMNYSKVPHAAPCTNNAVLLPLECLSGPIIRLGETHTMARKRKPSDFFLPPLRDRPFLLDFPHFLSLPLPQVKLSPFCTDSLTERHTFPDHKYYILEKSQVDYYR